MKVLFVASEVVPFVKTGGLADVSGALPKALKKLGIDIKVVMPLYSKIDKQKYSLEPMLGALSVPMGIMGEFYCEVYKGFLPDSDVEIFFIEHNQFFARDGIYNDSNAKGYSDNDNRYIFFSRASMELCKKISFAPDILHLNDWQSSPTALFLNSVYLNEPIFSKTASLLTIHNMEYQGYFYKGIMDVLGIGWHFFKFDNVEERDGVNLLKGAINNATLINTVSPTYAYEIQKVEFGYGLETTIQKRASDVYGILNGVDYEIWNPEIDKEIVANFSVDNLDGKIECKRDLQEFFSLEQRDVPIISMVTRLVKQKGVDVVAEIIHALLDLDIQFILLGSGDIWAEEFFKSIDRSNFRCYIGYNEPLAHKIEAGSDFFLMPSRFEPCGLNQLYSLKYGTLPIVRAVGGLNDSVDNYSLHTKKGDGFKFYDLSAKAIYDTVGWAVYTYYNDKEGMQSLIKNAMSKDFSWDVSAKEYHILYKLAYQKRNSK